MLFHIFGHINPHHGIFVPEKRLRQCLGKLRLADTRRAEEQEGTDGSVGVLQADTPTADSLCQCLHCFVLPDDSFVQNFLQMEQTLTFLLLHALHRDSRPTGNDFCDIICCHHNFAAVMRGFPCALCRLQAGTQTILQLFDFRRLFKFLCLNGSLLFLLQLCNSCLQLLDGGGRSIRGKTQAGGCFVNQVDCLIRQESLRYIACRKPNRRRDCFIRNAYPMVHFIGVLQCCQHLHGNRFCRLLHAHRLKPPLKGGILFNMLAVFLKSGCANQLNFPSCQSRLKNIRGINRALCRTCPDDGMDFINEKNDIACRLYILQCLFHAFLKFPTIFRACDHSGQIQRKNPLMPQGIGHIAITDFLRQTLHNRRFPDTGVTHQAGVILRSAAQNPNDTLNLLLSADNRVEFSLLCQCRHISAEFIQCFRLGNFLLRAFVHPLHTGRLRLAFTQKQHDILIQCLNIYAQILQKRDGKRIRFTQKCQQNMLCPDIICPQTHRLLLAALHHTLCARCHIQGEIKFLLFPLHFANALHHLMVGHILPLQRLCGNALLHQCQPKQNMLCADIFIAKLCCGLLCPLQHIKGLFCIFLLHPIHLPWFNLLAINDCDC